jgi:hypothetical protein
MIVVAVWPCPSEASWTNGPPVFVSMGVTLWPQLFLNVTRWSAIAGLTTARVTARMVAKRANMVIDERGGWMKGV